MTEQNKVGQPFPCPAEARRRRMADPNENRPGYKKSKVGWIPDDWASRRVAELGSVTYGLTVNAQRRDSTDLCPYLTVAQFTAHGLAISAAKFIGTLKGDRKRFGLHKNDILVVEGNGSRGIVGKADVCPDLPCEILHQNHLLRIRLHKGTYIPQLLAAYINSDHFRHYLDSKIITSSGLHTINSSVLAQAPIPLPPLPEQQKIAAILSTWDAAIEQTRDLIAAKKQQQNALMQQLLTGKRRLPGFTGEWEARRVGDVFTERRETNGDLTLLAITGQRGIIPAADIDRKDASNADKSRYKVIRVGDLGYNTMRMWQGVNAISSLEGIVSPAYTIAMPGRCLHSPFLKHYFKYEPVVYQFYRYSQGLVSDTWNLKFHHFAEIVLPFPDLSEQRAIAAILDTADRELKSLEDKLAALKEQKKGLMQKLLTGQVRVKTK